MLTSVHASHCMCTYIERVTNHDSIAFCIVYLPQHRYSGRLNLGGNQNKINILATKITAQMNRDWIHTGRRPAGICAVALQIACNTYNITTVTRKDICRVLRICDATVTKRIREFEQTPAALMSKDDFLQQLPPKFDRVTGDQIERVEFDPPSFITNRMKDGTVDALLNNRTADTKTDVKAGTTAATDTSSDDDANDSDNSSTSKSSSTAAPVLGKGKGNARKRKLAAFKSAAATPSDSDNMSVDNATDDDDDDSDTAQQQQSVTKGNKKRKRVASTTTAAAGSSSSKAAATKSKAKSKGKGKASAAITTSDQLSDLSDDELPQESTKKAASEVKSSSRSKSSAKTNSSDADECSNDDDEDYVKDDSDTDSSSNDDSDSDDSLSSTSNSKSKKNKQKKVIAAKSEKGKKQTKKRRTKKAKKPKKVIPVYDDVDPSDATATIQHAMIMRAQHAQYRQQGPKMIKRQDELQAVIDTTVEDMKNDLMMLEEQPIPEARDEFILPPIEVEVKHDDADNANDDTKDDTNGTAGSDKSAKDKQQQKQPEASDEVIEGELPDHNDDDNEDDTKHTIGSGGGGGSSSTTATSSSSKKKATKVTFAEINQYDGNNNSSSNIEIATADGVPIVYVDMTVAEAYDEAAAVARLTAELKLPEDDTYSDIDDDDFMREHIIPKADSARKAIVWQEINKVYLAAQEEKVKLEKQQIANNGGTKPVKRSYKKQKLAASAAHAIEKLANEKKISNKINYEAIKSAFDPDNSYGGASSSRSRHNSRNNNDATDSTAGGGSSNGSTENPYQNYTEIYEDVDDDDYKAQMDRTQRGRAVFGKGDDSISIRSTHPAPLSTTSTSKSNDDAANSSSSKGGSSRGKGKANKSSGGGGSSSSSNAAAAVVKQAAPEDDDNEDNEEEEEEEEVHYEHYSDDDYDGEEY
jgi:Brf1-like TBP-binding domain/Transcription factor TFIIB repeat